MFTARKLEMILGQANFVHVRGNGKIAKLMRIARNRLAVKSPDGTFVECNTWDDVSRYLNRLFKMKRKPRSPEEMEEAQARAGREARMKLYEFSDQACWRNQYKNGNDMPSFGALHYVNRTWRQTLCALPVPQHLTTYETYGDACGNCVRIYGALQRLAHSA